MNDVKRLLEKLGLLEINGFRFVKPLGGGSALSSLYINAGVKVVFKFLIAPRNKVELERFKLECSVLEMNTANSHRVTDNTFAPGHGRFTGPATSYPLPKVKFPIACQSFVYYFAYEFEAGQLLSDIDTSEYTLQEKTFLLYRIASGLSYLNQTGYSHRDLHPGNILIQGGYDMPDSRFMRREENDPRVKFLDMGSCQRMSVEYDWLNRIPRELDEDLVYEDNNRRVLASFVSMPPDFLDKGEETENYDTWAFGIYAYHLIFGQMPFQTTEISSITKLRKGECFAENYTENLKTLPVGTKKVILSLLSPRGEDRLPIHAIVRLFSWLVYDTTRFNNPEFIDKVIANSGFDPDHDPLDDIY